MKSSIRPLAIIILSIFGFLLIVSFYADRSQFELNAREMQTKLMSTDYQLDSVQYDQLKSPVLIDIRDEHQYVIDHLDQSINIPLSNILNAEYEAVLRSNHEKVLLAYNPIHAHEAWMLLTQLGHENLYVLMVENEEAQPVTLHEQPDKSMGGH